MIPASRLSTRVVPSLGTLSLHLEGRACRVGCEFCYLAARDDGEAAADFALLERLVGVVEFDELALALSEPVDARALEAVRAIAARRGRPLTVTTTLPIAAQHAALLDGVARLSLSVDPRKGAVDAARIDARCATLGARERVLIVTLVTPGFAADLFERGLLEALVELPHVDGVALHALKPPPPWCDRDFWLRSLARIAPLLDRALDSRLHLDCWVAARLLGLGGCPARPDLTPAPGGFAFRSCVYQPRPDRILAAPDPLAGFVAPERCPW
jgi:hypothetical protein